MPKKKGHLYERMCNKEIIRAVILKGSIGKKKRADVKMVLEDLDGFTDKVYDLLISESYTPTPPNMMKIHDSSSGKEREISIVPYYPDGIMHQLCVYAMKDILMRGMYHWSCASIPKRGNAHAMKYVKRSLRKDPKGTKHCAKLDIRHYYPSIQPRLLIWRLARKIKDKRFLKLVYSIIDSNPTGGLAIGFYLNQWLANYFLEPLDHFICTLDGVKYYVRNMDDMVLLGSSKKKLHAAVRSIAAFLQKMHLELKGNWQVFPVDARGIDFVGYRFYHDRTVLRRRNFLKLARNCRRVTKREAKGMKVPFRTAAGLLSRLGQLKHCNGTVIRQKHVDGKINIGRLKEIVRTRLNQDHSVPVVCSV